MSPPLSIYDEYLADADDGIRRIPGVLRDRQHELRRNGHLPDRPGGRLPLVAGQSQSAVQIAEIECRGAHASTLMLIQSTGHGATHNSQPVHSL